MDDPVERAEKKEFVSEGDINKLVATYSARKISEMKIEWPLAGGHKVTFHATRRVTESEFRTLLQLMRMAKAAFVVTPITVEPLTADGKGPTGATNDADGCGTGM